MKKRSGRSEGVRHRLLLAADDLFTEKGFANTGVREILKKSKVVPASFYDHFSSKEELVVAYLEQQKRKSILDLKVLYRKSKNLKNFTKLWTQFRVDQISNSQYFGCPFMKFAYQSVDSSPITINANKSIVEAWEKLLIQFMIKEYGDQLKVNAYKNTAKEILIIYEGSIAIWMLCRDISVIKSMEKKFINCLDNILKN